MPSIPSVRNIFTTLWTHKKKTVFGITCVGALLRYLQKREKDRRIFRSYCLEALKHGNENIMVTASPRRVTVLVKDTKTRNLFEKHALPLLNLAGLQVDVVLPEDYKQLTTVASVLDRSDADLVYVVGGDETVSRVLTGLLQSKEDDKSGKRSRKTGRLIPPVGIFSDDLSKSLRMQCENAMAVIRGVVHDASVLEVKVKDAEPLCVLDQIHWGRFADVGQIAQKYWYWGPLKYRFAYLWNAIKSGELEACEVDLQYIEPCSGCSKCFIAPKVQTSHWLWQLFVGKPKNAISTPDYSKVINDNCGVLRSIKLETVELILKNDSTSSAPAFNLVTGPFRMNETPFIREGWARARIGDPLLPTPKYDIGNSIRAREVEINFKAKDEISETQLVIGGELIKLADLSIRAIPKAIQLITVPNLNN